MGCSVWRSTLQGAYRGGMTDNGKARPLAAIVGDRLKAFREQHQLRQSDLATAAEKAGLSWSRSSVAALEAGTRNLSIEELILLPLVISNAGGLEEPFLPPESLVLLTRHSHVEADQISQSFAALTQGPIAKHHPTAVVVSSGGIVPDAQSDAALDPLADDLDLGISDGRADGSRELQKLQFQANEMAILRTLYEMYPKVDLDKVTRPEVTNYDLYFKVARRLDVPGSKIRADEYIKPFSIALWGRSFEAERDARAADRGPYESPRSAQAARGHVTREMISELNRSIAEAGPSLTALLREVEFLWGAPEELYKWSWEIARSMGRTAITEVQIETLPVVGHVIRSARESLSLSVSDVADSVGFSTVWVDWIEAGRPPLDVEQDLLKRVIVVISERVGIDPAVAIARLDAPIGQEFRPNLTERGVHRKPSRWRRS